MKYERIQKAHMWSIMQALFSAGLKPSWSRSSVTWKHNNVRFFIHPGEVDAKLAPQDIVNIAKRRCGIPIESQSDTQHHEQPSRDAATRNLIVSLEQDLAAAKQKAVEKVQEICDLRRRVQKAEAQLATAVLPRQTRNKSCQTEVENNAVETGVVQPPENSDEMQTDDTSIHYYLTEGLVLQVPSHLAERFDVGHFEGLLELSWLS
jgi:hypothetical protein